MTAPDALKKLRNTFSIIAPSLVAASFIAACSAQFWTTVLDYWLVWASALTGLASIPAAVAAVAVHGMYLQEMRSN
jgi:hypothetical protein